MDLDETSWCPICDKAIPPRRWAEPIRPPPPSASQSGGGAGLNSIPEESQTQASSQLADVATTVGGTSTKKYLIHIDLKPTGLYCSDACRLVDSDQDRCPLVSAAEQHDHLPCVYVNCNPQGSSSVHRQPVDTNIHLAHLPPARPTLPSLAKPGYDYDFAPPPVPIRCGNSEITASRRNEFSGGAIMAGRRMKTELLDPSLRLEKPYQLNSERRGQIPGWTDGTNAWRDATYNMSTKTPASVFTARSSCGIPSTLSRSFIRPLPPHPIKCAPMNVAEDNAELLLRFSRSFVRKGPQASNPSSSPSPTVSSISEKEKTALSETAGGKLCAPAVKVDTKSSDSSVSSSSKSSTPRRTISNGDVGDLKSSFFGKKPKIETRPWSYDNVATYPIMESPPITIKRKEKKIVDGKEVEVEIEVEVYEKRKRLFIFAPVTTVRL